MALAEDVHYLLDTLYRGVDKWLRRFVAKRATWDEFNLLSQMKIKIKKVHQRMVIFKTCTASMLHACQNCTRRWLKFAVVTIPTQYKTTYSLKIHSD